METILVPRPRSIRDPNRAASSLLLAQVQHLNEVEKGLPVRYQSGIFHKSIQTEGEAARYIRAVTEAIHAAHDDAVAEREKPTPKRRRVIEIAAVADEAGERKRRAGSKGKKSKAKKSQGKKKSSRG